MCHAAIVAEQIQAYLRVIGARRRHRQIPHRAHVEVDTHRGIVRLL